jgi:hypothetical protein
MEGIGRVGRRRAVRDAARTHALRRFLSRGARSQKAGVAWLSKLSPDRRDRQLVVMIAGMAPQAVVAAART